MRSACENSHNFKVNVMPLAPIIVDWVFEKKENLNSTFRFFLIFVAINYYHESTSKYRQTYRKL